MRGYCLSLLTFTCIANENYKVRLCILNRIPGNQLDSRVEWVRPYATSHDEASLTRKHFDFFRYQCACFLSAVKTFTKSLYKQNKVDGVNKL